MVGTKEHKKKRQTGDGTFSPYPTLYKYPIIMGRGNTPHLLVHSVREDAVKSSPSGRL